MIPTRQPFDTSFSRPPKGPGEAVSYSFFLFVTVSSYAPGVLRPILIIDDSPDDVDILCHGLRRAGIKHPVQSFSGGEEAITHLSEIAATSADDGWRPLLCILDVKMPGFHGAEVLQWIREHSAYASMPVVMCSSSDDPKDVAEAGQFGAQCYARKYPSASEFKGLVACAESFTGDARDIFDVPCNLLATLPVE